MEVGRSIRYHRKSRLPFVETGILFAQIFHKFLIMKRLICILAGFIMLPSFESEDSFFNRDRV